MMNLESDKQEEIDRTTNHNLFTRITTRELGTQDTRFVLKLWLTTKVAYISNKVPGLFEP
jgi:hypothetical protein